MNASQPLVWWPALVLSVGLPTIGHSEVIDEWEFRNPTPSYADLYNAAFGNGRYVFVGRGMGLHSTTDFTDWETEYRAELLENVIFSEGGFTASGSNGEILRSSNGLEWSLHDSGTDRVLPGLAFGGGRYMAVGEAGAYATSTDGVNWTSGSVGDEEWYWSVSFGEGLFVAVSSEGVIRSSSDGSNWSLASLDATVPDYLELYVVAYGGGRFIAGGYFEDAGIEGAVILSSEDGSQWSLVPDADIPNSGSVSGNNQKWVDEVKHDGSQFIACGDGGLLLVSDDGLSWTTRNAGTSTDLNGLAFGASGTVVFGQRGIYSVSQDHNNWVAPAPLQNIGYVKWLTLDYDGELFLMGGFGGSLVTSSDAVTWDRPSHPGRGNFDSSAHGAGRWVLASSANSDSIALITSQDGQTWTAAAIPADTRKCNGVAFGNSLFVASVLDGPSSLLLSENGTDWSAVNVADTNVLRGVAFGDGDFVTWTNAVDGNPIRILTSSDGENWVSHETPLTSGGISDACYGQGVWNFVGSSGQVLRTSDFSEWSLQELQFDGADPGYLDSIEFGNGHWVIVASRHRFWSSSDGITWQEAFTTGMSYPGDRFWDLTFDGESFWATGESGALIQSEVISNDSSGRGPVALRIRNGAPGFVILTVEGSVGDDWELLHSKTLPADSWQPQEVISLTEPLLEISKAVGVEKRGFFLLRVPGSD